MKIDTMLTMSYQEIESYIGPDTLILLPIGSTEAHGPHLPTGSGSMLAFERCRLMKEELLKRGKKALVAPPFYWGISNFAESYPGSFGISEESFSLMLFDIFRSLRANGFTKVLGMNTNGRASHVKALLDVFKRARTELKMDSRVNYLESFQAFTDGTEEYILSLPPSNAGRISSAYPDKLAGDTETSSMLAFYPDFVDLEKAKKLQPVFLSDAEMALWEKGGENAKELVPQGYIGAPADYALVEEDYHDYIDRVTTQAIIDFKL